MIGRAWIGHPANLLKIGSSADDRTSRPTRTWDASCNDHTRKHGIAQYARWASRWICVLALSVGFASVLNVALAGAPSAREACYADGGRLLYVGLNSWIPADPRVGPCPIGGP